MKNGNLWRDLGVALVYHVHMDERSEASTALTEMRNRLRREALRIEQAFSLALGTPMEPFDEDEPVTTSEESLADRQPPGTSLTDDKSEIDGGLAQTAEREPKVQPGTTVKGLAVRAFESEPRRVWTFDSIIEHYGDQGIRLPAKDPRDALRTAARNLVLDGKIERVGRGAYRLADCIPDPPEQGALGVSDPLQEVAE